ncbi:MAG: hypothetical protein ACE5KK_01170 [Candidatus Brocadiales bacterium]
MWVCLKIFLLSLLLSSCALHVPEGTVSPGRPAQETAGRPAYIEAVPNFVGVASGLVRFVYVTVLDQERKPLPGQEVRAVIADPAVAILDNDRRFTDEEGKVTFTLTGVGFPDYTTLTFYVEDLSYSIVVDGFSASMA